MGFICDPFFGLPLTFFWPSFNLVLAFFGSKICCLFFGPSFASFWPSFASFWPSFWALLFEHFGGDFDLALCFRGFLKVWGSFMDVLEALQGWSLYGLFLVVLSICPQVKLQSQNNQLKSAVCPQEDVASVMALVVSSQPHG
jgi:hypothetical protein